MGSNGDAFLKAEKDVWTTVLGTPADHWDAAIAMADCAMPAFAALGRRDMERFRGARSQLVFIRHAVVRMQHLLKDT